MTAIDVQVADAPRNVRGEDRRQRVQLSHENPGELGNLSWHDDALCATDPNAAWWTEPPPPGRAQKVRRYRRGYIEATCKACPVFALCQNQARLTRPLDVWMAGRFFRYSER